MQKKFKKNLDIFSLRQFLTFSNQVLSILFSISFMLKQMHGSDR